ncbi:MAG: lipopolysaccharide kinase InaA family protein [bacterium]|nr:lipopolysaccharide kinase InaA family protein [bacterium]
MGDESRNGIISTTVSVRGARGIRWRVNPAHAPLFLADRQPDPLALLKGRRGEIIKRSPARVIFSSTLDDGDGGLPVVIKVYRHPRLGDWIKANLCGSKGSREWDVTVAAAGRGLPTVVPVAFGERRRLGLLQESYLITVRLYDCLTLEEVLFSPDRSRRAGGRRRRRVIVLLAGILRRMHDRGIHHLDLHPGNFLVGRDAAGGDEIHLLDLHRANVRASLPPRARIRSLSQFNMFARISLSRSERLLFFDAYFGADRLWQEEKRLLLERIDSLTRRMSWRLWRRRERRCLERNKYFMRLDFARMRGFARRDAWKGEMARFLLGGLVPGEGALVKESRSKALWERGMEIGGERRTLVIKHYRPKRGWKAAAYLFRPSQAIRSWRGAYALRIRNIETVNAVAALEERRAFGRLGNAYFISDKVPGVEHLAAAAARPLDAEGRRRLVRGLALFLRRLHDRGAAHGDMKATNILVGGPAGGPFSFSLSDLDLVRTGPSVRRRRVVRALAQLNKSLLDLDRADLFDRRRFLRIYAGPHRRREAAALWRAVSRRTAAYLRKSGRRFSRGGGR